MGPAVLIKEDKALSQLLSGSGFLAGPEDPGRKEEQTDWPGCSGCKQQKLTLDLSKRDFTGNVFRLNGKTRDLALK